VRIKLLKEFKMPCPPELIKRVDAIVDQILAAKKDEIRARFDGTPERIHGAPDQERRIDELWGTKPRVPIPIETI
jgi:hypothetical protein